MPQTAYDHIVEIWPLHAQRIMELSSVDWRTESKEGYAQWVLMFAFVWHDTSEGFEYWEALASIHK